jgi:phage N-6-adenine-methyltransferase
MLSRIVLSSQRHDWKTPAEIFDRAQRALGQIDLDPCAGSGNRYARRHFTPREDGLAQPWHGRIFLNPPYGRQVAKWIRKLTDEFDAGRVTEVVALLKMASDTLWFQPLVERGAVLCLVHGRLHFSDAKAGATFPSVVAYLGPHPARFAKAFNDTGAIYAPMKIARSNPIE